MAHFVWPRQAKFFDPQECGKWSKHPLSLRPVGPGLSVVDGYEPGKLYGDPGILAAVVGSPTLIDKIFRNGASEAQKNATPSTSIGNDQDR